MEGIPAQHSESGRIILRRVSLLFSTRTEGGSEIPELLFGKSFGSSESTSQHFESKVLEPLRCGGCPIIRASVEVARILPTEVSPPVSEVPQVENLWFGDSNSSATMKWISVGVVDS